MQKIYLIKRNFSMENINSEILGLLNSWKYKRAQPYKIARLKKIIEECVSNNLPIPLFGYWGIGNKKECNSYETDTICYLKSLVEKVKEIYAPGLQIIFILSDVHALNNCIPENITQNYAEKVKKLLEENGFQTVLLSDLYKKYNLSPKTVIENANENNKLWWQFFPLKKDLIKQAQNVSLCEDKNLSAKRYALIRKEELKFLEKEYLNKIFITYSSPHFKILYPDLPTIYLYTEKKGCNIVPWFNN